MAQPNTRSKRQISAPASSKKTITTKKLHLKLCLPVKKINEFFSKEDHKAGGKRKERKSKDELPDENEDRLPLPRLRIDLKRLQEVRLPQELAVSEQLPQPKRKRGRPSREEMKQRKMEMTKNLPAQPSSTTALPEEFLQKLWEWETRTLKSDFASYREKVLARALIFADPPVHDHIPHDFRPALTDLTQQYQRLCRLLDSRLGMPELAVLDQRLCLEEERFLLQKLQRSIKPVAAPGVVE